MLIRLNPYLSNASGSVGGVTISRNNAGHYIKKCPVPDNPPSSFTASLRSNFSALTSQWSTLSDSNQNLWREYASNIWRSNKIGTRFTMTGQNLFISCNQNRFLLGLPVIPVPLQYPLYHQFSRLELSPDYGLQLLQFGLYNGSVCPDLSYLCSITPPKSPGINYCKNTFARVLILPPGISAMTISFADYQNRFNMSFAPGWNYFAKAVPIHGPSGFAGLPLLTKFCA